MRRSPFYAYPSYPFRSPQTNFYANDAYHPLFPQHQDRPSPQPSSSQPPRSVINIPVFDSASPPPPPSPPRKKTPSAPHIDPVFAAIVIQSCFRGFSVRRHNPLLHLRTISTSRKQLGDLKSQLESPGFFQKVRSNEKERLRFSESVMAVILRLDAIEGSIPEVRNQRKEATKLAIKLQDAMDAIMSEQEEEVHSKSADRDPPDVDSESMQCSEATALQEITPLEESSGSRDVNMMQEVTSTIKEDCSGLVGARKQERETQDVVRDESAEVIHDVHGDPIEAVDNDGLHQCHLQGRYAVQDESVDAMDSMGKNLLCRQVDLFNCIDATEGTGVQPAVGSCNGLCMEANKDGYDGLSCAVLNEGLCMEVSKDTQKGTTCAVMNVDNADVTNFVSAIGGDSYVHTDVCEEDAKGVGQGASSSPDTPHAEDQLDGNKNADDFSPMVEEVLNPQGPIEIGQLQNGTSMEVNTSWEDGLQDLDAVPRDGVLSSSDSVFLKELSEECGKLRSMLGKLLAQSKAQSKVICALGDRLEMLEYQQQRSLQNNQQRGKRKLKKGSKRCVRCRNRD